MRKKVKKAVIPAAGLGTRFLPGTKTVPKELFPIVDTPILFHIVEEAVKAGIEDIILVAGRGKTAIEDFFDTTYELEDKLLQTNKLDVLEKIKSIKDMANIISIRQKTAMGLGHAVYTAKPIVGNEPFAVLLGDELMFTPEGSPTVTQQLTEKWDDTMVSTVAVMPVAETEVSKYGIIDFEKLNDSTMKVKNVVEKPDLTDAPSNYALPGRYVFDAKIFSYLENTKPGKNGEIQLTDGMTSLCKNEGLHAVEYQGQRYDAGDKLGYLQANIEYALRTDELSDKLKAYLTDLTKRF